MHLFLLKLSIMRFMDTKHIMPEMQLLLLCTKVSLSPEDIHTVQNIASKLQNPYKTLIQLAYSHAVVPQLYHTFNIHFPHHTITTTLKPHYLHIVQTNMAMSSALIDITQLLEAHQIPTLHFKGPVLATQVYNDITLRQYGDLDMLIRKEDKKAALSLLKTEGFTPEIVLQTRTKETFFSAVNVLGFQSPNKRIFVEVHWELLSKNYAIKWEESDLWGKTQSVIINKQPLQTLSHTNHFLYLCTHGSKHLYERLSWVSDIDHYIQTQPNLNWEEVITGSKKLGISRILSLSLYLVQYLLDTPLPSELKKAIAQDVMAKKLAKKLITLHFSHTQPSKKGFFTFTLLCDMREKRSDKIRFAWYALFATKLDDFRFIQLPRYLAFLYPFIRPLRLMIKYLK